MAHDNAKPYAVKGNVETEQSESSTANRGAGTIEMRTLVELQVISRLLHEMMDSTEDLAQMRQDIADSIT